jgi:hypothetical protein
MRKKQWRFFLWTKKKVLLFLNPFNKNLLFFFLGQALGLLAGIGRFQIRWD